MAQKEIVYLSFGSFSNHIATHFWNEQQSYFLYDDETAAPPKEDEQLIDHDVSFRVGEDIHGNATYHPRTLAFEAQQEFGALRRQQALDQAFDEDKLPLDALTTWSARAQVVAQESAPVSEYQRRLQLEDQGLSPDDDQDEEAAPHRFWSDYARVPYHAKSLVSVGGQLMAPMSGSINTSSSADAQDGRNRFETFDQGSSIFSQLEQDQEVMDTNLRWFVEDADLLQGFQYTIDSSTGFGGLGCGYLERMVDEYPKLSHLVFGASWGNLSLKDDDAAQSRLARVRSINDVLCLTQFMEHATLTTPIRVPETGADDGTLDWRRNVDRGRWHDMHHAAALVSAHLETATLGPRLRSRNESLASLCGRLNWRRDTKIAHLGGCLPLPYPAPLGSSRNGADPVDALLASYGYGQQRDGDHRARQRGEPLESESDLAQRGSHALLTSWLDLSLPSRPLPASSSAKLLFNLQNPFATNAVMRNTDIAAMSLSLDMLSRLVKINPPFGQGVYIPLSYNVPSSYPAFWSTAVGRPADVPVISALTTTPSTVHLLRDARETLSQVINGHQLLQAWGLDPTTHDRDALKDMRETIENAIDSYNVNHVATNDDGQEQDGMGTDEEYEPDYDPADANLDWD